MILPSDPVTVITHVPFERVGTAAAWVRATHAPFARTGDAAARVGATHTPLNVRALLISKVSIINLATK